MNNAIFLVEALRYGDENDTYFLSWETDLEIAKARAIKEWEYRGCMKYSGVVYEVEKGSDNKIEVFRQGL